MKAYICGMVVVFAAASFGGETPNPAAVKYDAKTAFQFLKSMKGDWEYEGDHQHDHGAGSNLSSFRPTAADSAVMQVIFAGEPHEMISMFHMDGDKLLLTHYCALQNAPVLRFEKSDKPGEIKFVFQGGTNFDPSVDAHMHEGSFIIKDANTVETKFVGHTNGKPDETPCGTLKRKK